MLEGAAAGADWAVVGDVPGMVPLPVPDMAVLFWVPPVPAGGAAPRPLRPKTPTMPPKVNSGKRNPQRVAVRCSEVMPRFWAGWRAPASDSP